MIKKSEKHLRKPFSYEMNENRWSVKTFSPPFQFYKVYQNIRIIWYFLGIFFIALVLEKKLKEFLWWGMTQHSAGKIRKNVLLWKNFAYSPKEFPKVNFFLYIREDRRDGFAFSGSMSGFSYHWPSGFYETRCVELNKYKFAVL